MKNLLRLILFTIETNIYLYLIISIFQDEFNANKWTDIGYFFYIPCQFGIWLGFLHIFYKIITKQITKKNH